MASPPLYYDVITPLLWCHHPSTMTSPSLLWWPLVPPHTGPNTPVVPSFYPLPSALVPSFPLHSFPLHSLPLPSTLVPSFRRSLYLFVLIPLYHGAYFASYPGTSYPGTNTLVPRIWYPRTPDLIPSYPGTNTLVPRIWYPRTTDLILSYPGTNTPLYPNTRFRRFVRGPRPLCPLNTSCGHYRDHGSEPGKLQVPTAGIYTPRTHRTRKTSSTYSRYIYPSYPSY